MLIINISFTLKIITFYLLDILLPNSNFKTIYNYIYLLLLLNKLEHLLFKDILNYNIKNKEKMYFNLDQ